MRSEAAGRTWEAGVRWAAVLAEPLLAPARREALEADLAAAAEQHPDWALRFFAGAAFDTAQTLPLVDPWRRVTAGPDGPVLDGRPFGSAADHADLVPQVMPDLSIDVALVAVADPLSEQAAAVVAAAFDSDDRAVEALRAGAQSGGGIIEVGSAALRSLAFRRRCYIGMVDLWVYDSCWWRAEFEWKALHGEIDDDEARTLSADRIGRERIPDEAYLPDDSGSDLGLSGT